MPNWMTWIVIAGILVTLEIFTGTFYLLMIAIGVIAGAGVAGWGGDLELQIFVTAVVGVLSTVALRRSRWGRIHKVDSARDRNVNLDIGEHVVIDEWVSPSAGRYVSRTMYRGAMWDIDLGRGAQPNPGSFKIIEIQGSRLVVTNQA
jgi:membrane protein implicated in regulation of membrane protease activity